MATMHRPTIVGVFNRQDDAEQAVRQLCDTGIPREHISYSGTGGKGDIWENIKHLFSGKSSSADTVKNDLVQIGLEPDEADYYAHQHDEGHPLVAVSNDEHVSEILLVLRRTGAYDFGSRHGFTEKQTPADERRGDIRDQSFDRPGTGPARVETDQVMRRPTLDPNYQAGNVESGQARSMPLHEEQIQVEKQRVQTGEVSLHKEVVEERRSIDVPVTHEEVVVEWKPAHGNEPSNIPIGEGDTIRIPVSEEQVNVSKTSVTTGEVSIEKRSVEETQRVSDTVKREQARVNQQGRVRSNIDAGNNPDIDDAIQEDRPDLEQGRYRRTIDDDTLDNDRRRI